MATQIQTMPQDANIQSPKTISDTAAPDTNVLCPDPSAHKTKDTSFQDHASAAAFNNASLSQRPPAKVTDPLGPNGKLSSASAATSLRHANAHDLPSFPVVGIDTLTSAGTAATLANDNRKSLEPWKPEYSSAAGKAALLAHGYKMAPTWQPEASTAGSKAALLAHRSSTTMSVWTPEANPDGHSAATLAMQRQGTAPGTRYGQTEGDRHRALIAATGAVSSSGRQRAQSTPAPPQSYPDAENSSKNALRAATSAHAPSVKAMADGDRLAFDAMEAARIQHSKGISREMYTSAPPVRLEVEEKKKQDALRASAISMAKQMYEVQQHQHERSGSRSQSQAQTGAAVAHGKHGENDDIREQALRYIGVQEAAQKLAAERLAKIGFDENAAYRSYYGYQKPTRSRLSIRLSRRRSSSDPEARNLDDDEMQTRRIRSQMSNFNRQLAEVDAKKQEQDRRYLLAAAQRRVQAQMHGLDKKIFDETGQMSPAMMEEWDAQARAKAAAASEARMENHGKVHIGQGKYMDQADIDAVAQARIQPTLDEITEKTEKRRAEEEERRLDLEERRREEQMEKERAAELKAEEKRIRDEEKKAAKARTAEEKAAAKQEKEAEKAKRAQEKRMAKEEQKPEDLNQGTVVSPPALTVPSAQRTPTSDNRENDSLYRDPTPADRIEQPQSNVPSSPVSPTSPSSPKSDSGRIHSFLSKFKRRSKHSAATAETENDNQQKPGFIGGAALRQSSAQSNKNDTDPSSPLEEASQVPDPSRRYSDVSSLSAGADGADDRDGRPEQSGADLSPVSSGVAADIDEARDSFDERLAPPPSFPSLDAAAARKGSPNRDSKFYEVGI